MTDQRNWNSLGFLLAAVGISVSLLLPLLFAFFQFGLPFGDLLGIYGGIIGAVGLWYTVLQLYLTKKAAIAAKEAAIEAGQRFARQDYLGQISETDRLITEVMNWVDAKQWKKSVLRLRDLNVALRRLHVAMATVAQPWTEHAECASFWADYYTQGIDTKSFGADNDRDWRSEIAKIQSSIDQERASLNHGAKL